ncbi:hypothetical protein C8Q80DRAFT_1222392 [Daedaleopsis nitida]|nr:hypothetical protein C8Q80DRAFT_1222392 [Daedaleopsis nitida]
MASPLVLPGKYFFYPLGNTSAVCLTRDISPDASADILLIPCGDPRNVLFTVFCESQNVHRKLDFTCCDYDPGVLARNALLFALILDSVPMATTWNIFYHINLDEATHSALVTECQKLIRCASTLQDWRSSSYGRTLRIGSEHTLAELRRHWELYVSFGELHDSPTGQSIRELVDKVRQRIMPDYASDSGSSPSSRSVGPLSMSELSYDLYHKHFKHYWRTGTTFTNPEFVAAATYANPTFFYSKAGEGFHVHYGTDPITSFHLAPLFGNAHANLTIQDMVTAAQSEFLGWCAAFRTAVRTPTSSAPIVRFHLGDAIAVARVLQVCRDQNAYKVPQVAVAPWTARPLVLDEDEYSTFNAPTCFDVVDTSNLSDHIGLLNVLLFSIPLLSDPSRTPVLYTESLLSFKPSSQSASELTSRLFADLSTVALILDIAPVDALSGFTTRCDTHETLTWKRPGSCDVALASQHRYHPTRMVFDVGQLARLMCNVYSHLFADDDISRFVNTKNNNMELALLRSARNAFSRELFVIFLHFLRHRLQVPVAEWSEIMGCFLNLHLEATSLSLLDIVSHRDLQTQLFLHQVYRCPDFDKTPKLSLWHSIPSLVRVYLTIPQSRLTVFPTIIEKVGAPWLQCVLRSPQDGLGEHIFQSVHVAYGQVVREHPSSSDSAVYFQEDLRGDSGDSPLVAWFVVPGRLLTDVKDPNSVIVGLTVRMNPHHLDALLPILGPSLIIFSTPLEDRQHVHLCPEQPSSTPLAHFGNSSLCRSQSDETRRPLEPRKSPGDLDVIGQLGRPLRVELDPDCKRVTLLTARIEVEDGQAKSAFANGATPSIVQTSACVDLAFPLPVIGSQRKVRLARKSSYIEVRCPWPRVTAFDPFPLTRSGMSLVSWNIHRVPLDVLPILNIRDTSKVAKWSEFHIFSQLSIREQLIRRLKTHTNVLVHVKDTIHCIMVRAMGTQGGAPARTFALRNAGNGDCDTIFSHTIVCDAFVLPLTPTLLAIIERPFDRLVRAGLTDISVSAEEMPAWKRLLPALVERCRTWAHGPNCEYVAEGKVPLETRMSRGDPLCSCGRGRDTEGMIRGGALWKSLAPYVTRIALSPIFAVSYLEPVFDSAIFKSVCGHEATLRRCSGCKMVFYCSEVCQKRDWRRHRPECKI